ncbi:MAG TPA: hypothetical protein VL991_06870 [Terracidiphilus sp.]|nr:hypothetical protein [Terracidiphilus sp.]
MKISLALMLAGLVLGAGSRMGFAADPVFVVDFSNPDLNPPHWTLTVHPDGSGHFHSEMGKPAPGSQPEIDAPSIDRDVQLTPSFAAHVFEAAQHKKYFNEDCDSHLKVAFQGWKKFSYTGPEGNGSCTFNYSKDKDIEGLSDSLNAVAETILEGARLESLLQHDRLGLDKEMEFLVDAAGNGRAQQICTIREILVRLAQDDEVLERVRKRARLLLAQGGTT